MTVDLRGTALRWQTAGRPAVVVEVLSSKGSVPREAGTRMLVAVDDVAGTIGGGHIRTEAIADARALLHRATRRASRRHVALGQAMGQCCGGLPTSASRRWPAFNLGDSAACRRSRRCHAAAVWRGHVGRAIVRLLATLLCRVTWIDEREDQFRRMPRCRRRSKNSASNGGCRSGRQRRRASATGADPSHEIDMALTRPPAARRHRAGSASSVHAPNAPGSNAAARSRRRRSAPAQMGSARSAARIRGKQPEVIAMAVVAQLLQVASQADRRHALGIPSACLNEHE